MIGVTLASKATRQAARSLLSRHATAIECVRAAASMTGLQAEVVVFDERRVSVAASTETDTLMMPRPMTAAEAAAVAAGGTDIVEGPDGSMLLPLVFDGEVVAGLSLFGGPLPTSIVGLEALGRLLAAVVSDLETESGEGFHERVLSGLRDSVLIVSPSLEILWASKGVTSLLGYNPLEIIGRSAADFVHEDDLEETLNVIIRISEGLEVYRLDVRVRAANDEFVPLEVTGTDMASDPLIGGIVMSLRDAQRDAELGVEVERSRQMSSAIVEGLPDGLVATDRYGSVTVANSVARTMFALDPDAAASQLDLSSFAVVSLDGRHVDLLEPMVDPIRCLLPSEGDLRHLDVFCQSVVTNDGEEFGRVLVFTDVTSEHRAADELRRQALHDQLTGLANRRQLEARLIEEASRRTPPTVAACFIDLDAFKLVNDNHGHRIGDQVIRIAADRLAAVLRTEDLLVRHGGDEFVALLIGVDRPTAELIAERALSALARPYIVDSERFDLTASIGLALSSSSGLSPERLLQEADIALYEAKGNGRNRVEVFDASLAEAVRNEQAQQRLLRDALDEDRIVMHFQPLVDATSERIRGFEALARIETTEGETLLPASFLEAVAHTSLMWELDCAAFVRSCDAAKLLAALDPDDPPYVACNFSSVSLTHSDFLEFVVETTSAAGIRPQQIWIEVTESAAFDSGSRSARALTELRSHGFELALDDFGTGYSSLAHLRDLPITTVKVDRSFIERLTVNASERAITEAVVTLARDLNLGVVAEGVETTDQLSQVRELGFQTVQGWHYSPAVPIDRCLDYWQLSNSPLEPTRATIVSMPGG